MTARSTRAVDPSRSRLAAGRDRATGSTRCSTSVSSRPEKARRSSCAPRFAASSRVDRRPRPRRRPRRARCGAGPGGRRHGRPRARGPRAGGRPRRAAAGGRPPARAARRRGRRPGAHVLPRASSRSSGSRSSRATSTCRGETTYDLYEGVERGDDFPHRERRRAAGLRASRAGVGEARAHPSIRTTRGRIRTPRGSTALSIGTWLRSVDALPSTIRRLEVGSLALADGSIEHSSLLAELRKSAAVGEHEFYSYERWESLQVAEGSAEVAERLAVGAGRARAARGRGRARSQVGEQLQRSRSPPVRSCARRRSSARFPRPSLRGSSIDGVDPERLRSLRSSAPRARGEGRRRLPALGLGRLGLERPLGRRARPGLDVAAARGRALGARASGAARIPACADRPTTVDEVVRATSWSGCSGRRGAAGDGRSTSGSGRPTPSRAAT